MKKKSASKRTVRTQNSDIINLILDDHRALKRLIKIMKDLKKSSSVRESAFNEFTPLLLRHAKPEEQVLYDYLKKEGAFRAEGFEGEIEHAIADQLLEEAHNTDEEDLWSAKVKILAELVEHHLEEEEKRLFPKFKKYADSSIRKELGLSFLEAKEDFLNEENEISPELQPMQMTNPH